MVWRLRVCFGYRLRRSRDHEWWGERRRVPDRRLLLRCPGCKVELTCGLTPPPLRQCRAICEEVHAIESSSLSEMRMEYVVGGSDVSASSIMLDDYALLTYALPCTSLAAAMVAALLSALGFLPNWFLACLVQCLE